MGPSLIPSVDVHGCCLPPVAPLLLPGVKLDGQSVTLEPGGQFELSGAPVSTLHQTCAEVNSHLYQVRGWGMCVCVEGVAHWWRFGYIPGNAGINYICEDSV